MVKKNRAHRDLRKSSSLPSRSGHKNIEQWQGIVSETAPSLVQVELDRVHQVLREFKVGAKDIKATFKKYEKKKKTTEIEEVRFLARNLGRQLHELYQLLGIKDDSRRGSIGRRRSIDDIQTQLLDRNAPQDPNACHRCKQLAEWNKQIRHDQEEALSRCKQLDERNKKLTSEKEEALTRLSQLAGSKLRENNPAIADLSDPNRPMKLAEKVSELYDNEWTETAELLEQQDKNIQYIELLRDIFIESYKFCMEAADKQLNAIYQLITYTRRHQHSNHVISLPPDVKGKCKDFRKTIAETSISSFDLQSRLWHYVEDKQGEAVATICSDYIGKCVRYSWYMCIQDPPIHMDYSHKEGDKFEQDFMRAYTKTGPCIEFLVWPALHLHRDGPLLSKAIVQGFTIPKKDPPKPKVTEHIAVEYAERQTSYQNWGSTPVSYHVENKGIDEQASRNRDNMNNRKRPGYNDQLGQAVYAGSQVNNNRLGQSVNTGRHADHNRLGQSVNTGRQVDHNRLGQTVNTGREVDHNQLAQPVNTGRQVGHNQLAQPVNTVQQVHHHQQSGQPTHKSKQTAYPNMGQQRFNQTYHYSGGQPHHERSQHQGQSPTRHVHQPPNIHQSHYPVHHRNVQNTPQETVL